MNPMHELGVRMVKDHGIVPPTPHRIICKASTERKKFGEFAFGMDALAADKLDSNTYIIHVDVRTRTIGGAFLDMLRIDDGRWPIIENTKGVGRCVYWPSIKLTTLAVLTDDEVNELIDLRTKRKHPGQQKLF